LLPVTRICSIQTPPKRRVIPCSAARLCTTRTMPPVLHFLFSILFLYLPLVVKSSSLTTTIAPNERMCFYADVDKAGEKIGVCAPLYMLVTRIEPLTLVFLLPHSFITLCVLPAPATLSFQVLKFPNSRRSNPAALSTSTLTSKTPTKRSYWRASASGKGTTSSPPTPPANTPSALRMTCRR